jgi:hypothetical protein
VFVRVVISSLETVIYLLTSHDVVAAQLNNVVLIRKLSVGMLSSADHFVR